MARRPHRGAGVITMEPDTLRMRMRHAHDAIKPVLFGMGLAVGLIGFLFLL